MRLKKSGVDLGGPQGRKISTDDRRRCIELIEEAKANGCRIGPACDAFGIHSMCYFRWKKNPDGDRRKGPNRIYNKLSVSEREKIIEISCSPEFRDKHPKQIVPILADRGIYIACETTFYRVLREHKLLAHRSPVSPPRHSKPKELTAVGPNQVWSWDITYLKSSVLGMFYYLYLVIDIYSRKIIAWDIAPYESAEISVRMIKRACRIEKVKRRQLYIHSDNGGPMKAGTMLATLRRLGVLPSFSRPSVSERGGLNALSASQLIVSKPTRCRVERERNDFNQHKTPTSE